MDDDEFEVEVGEFDDSGIPLTWADIPSAVLGVIGLGLRGLSEGFLGFKRVLDYHSLYRARRRMAVDSFRAEAGAAIESMTAPKEG